MSGRCRKIAKGVAKRCSGESRIWAVPPSRCRYCSISDRYDLSGGSASEIFWNCRFTVAMPGHTNAPHKTRLETTHPTGNTTKATAHAATKSAIRRLIRLGLADRLSPLRASGNAFGRMNHPCASIIDRNVNQLTSVRANSGDSSSGDSGATSADCKCRIKRKVKHNVVCE